MADVTQAVGKLVVAVTTAQGTIPLPGALVTVSAQTDRKSTRLNSSHVSESRMPSSA